jgi:hypothetical protein
LSKHNYTQYSNKKHRAAIDEVTDKTSFAATFDTPLEVKMEPKFADAEPETAFVIGTTIVTKTTGIVTDCVKLNVRVAPVITATVACVLDANSEIEIDMTKSTDEWFHVTTAAGVEGYCMRMFVDTKL